MKRRYTVLGAGLLLLAFFVWLIATNLAAAGALGVMMLGGRINQYALYAVMGVAELLLAVPLAVYMLITKTGVRALLGNRTSLRQNLFAVLVGAAMVPALAGLNTAMDTLFRLLGATPPDTSYLEPREFGQLLAGVAAIGLTAGVVEEPLFRGVVQRGLGGAAGRRAAVLLTALAFSLVHLDVVGALSRFLIGAVLGYMAWRAGAMLPGILAHAAFNGTSLGVGMLIRVWIPHWEGFFPGVSADANGVLSWCLVSIPFIALSVLLYRLFARATPDTASWGARAYAAREVRAAHWLPWISAGLGILVMTALTALTMWLDTPGLDQFFG